MRSLDQIGSRARNLEPVLSGRAAALETMVVTELFGGSQTPRGVPWAPLRTPRKRGQTSSASPLIDTGQLRGSIHAAATPSSILFGSSGAATEYAGTHLFGHGPVPQRKFLPTTEADFEAGPAKSWLDRLKSRVAEYVTTGRL